MARVFISHSSRDGEAARDLFEALRARGFEQGFLDIDKHKGIPPGERWEQKLYDELERAQAVILLLSGNWFDSKWCFAEFAQARSRGKAIFPVIVAPGGDQYIGDDLQKLDLTTDRENGLDRLAERLTEVAVSSQGGFDFPAGRAPYPGFLAFDEDDAAIYFGRDDDIRRLIQRLDSRRIEGGRRFVLVLGESGTGKSSLLRAGLIPRLRKAKRDWLVLPAFRPESDPFEGVALGLTEAGFPITAEELPNADPKAIAQALAATNDARRAGILVPIDQAEELFTRTPPQRRAAFLAFLSRLLGPGLPFVAVGTLRSDHLGDIQTADGLATEFEDFALRPLPVERIGDIVRGPARISGLEIEDDLVSRIVSDARTTDALPLVAYALRRLYDDFGGDNRLQLIEYESLRDAGAGLSPLETIVRETASRVIADEKPADHELKALREAFVPGLVRINDEGGFVRQAARVDMLPKAARRLIAALAGSQARLLVVREREGRREVEVAHEALFRVWPLLSGWLEEEREFLVGRNRLEKALADWRALPEGERDRGLIAGILLDRAREWLLAHPGRFGEDEAAYIRASDAAETERKRQAEEQQRALEAARLRQAETERDAATRISRRTRIAAAVLGAVALVAVGAGILAFRAEERAVGLAVVAEQARSEAETEAVRAAAEAERATRNFEIAKSTVDQVIVDIARGLRSVEGMRTENVRTILSRVDEAVQELADAAPDDTGVQRSRSVMLDEFGQTYLAAGDGSAALSAFEEALAIARRLAETDPDNTQWQRDVSVSVNRVGDLMLQTGDASGALAAYEEGLAIARGLADTDPENKQWQEDVAYSLDGIGDLRLRAGNTAAAQAAYEESLAIRRRLAEANPEDATLQASLSVSLQRFGDVAASIGDASGALAFYEELLQIAQRLADLAPESTRSRRNVSTGHFLVGDAKLQLGDADGALAAFEEALAMRRYLAGTDPTNANWQRDISVALDRIGVLRQRSGDVEGALAAYEESLSIRRGLTEADPGNVQWQRDLAVSLNGIADIKRATSDSAAAVAAYEEGLAILQRLAVADPENPRVRRDISVFFDRIGESKLATGDAAAALAAYEDGLAVARRLSDVDPDNAQWQGDVWFSLRKIGDLKFQALDDAEGALAAHEESLAIARRLVDLDPGNGWPHELFNGLRSVAFVSLFAGEFDRAESAAREALSLSPEQTWLETYLAHALMLQGRTDEADSFYLGNRDIEILGKPWQDAVLGGFADLRAAGINHPHMDHLEGIFASAPTTAR